MVDKGTLVEALERAFDENHEAHRDDKAGLHDVDAILGRGKIWDGGRSRGSTPPTCKHCGEQHDTGVVCSQAIEAAKPYHTHPAAMVVGQVERGAELRIGVAADALRAAVESLLAAGFTRADLAEALRLERRRLKR